jgi:hypothetical protein
MPSAARERALDRGLDPTIGQRGQDVDASDPPVAPDPEPDGDGAGDEARELRGQPDRARDAAALQLRGASESGHRVLGRVLDLVPGPLGSWRGVAADDALVVPPPPTRRRRSPRSASGIRISGATSRGWISADGGGGFTIRTPGRAAATRWTAATTDAETTAAGARGASGGAMNRTSTVGNSGARAASGAAPTTAMTAMSAPCASAATAEKAPRRAARLGSWVSVIRSNMALLLGGVRHRG